MDEDLLKLKKEAHEEMDSCCQTLCVSSVVKEYIDKLEKEIERLIK